MWQYGGKDRLWGLYSWEINSTCPAPPPLYWDLPLEFYIEVVRKGTNHTGDGRLTVSQKGESMGSWSVRMSLLPLGLVSVLQYWFLKLDHSYSVCISHIVAYLSSRTVLVVGRGCPVVLSWTPGGCIPWCYHSLSAGDHGLWAPGMCLESLVGCPPE